MHPLWKAGGAALLSGVAGLGYAALVEVRAYRLRRYDVPVLAPGSRPLRVLHLSDLHLTPGQAGKVTWVRRLAALRPDIVVSTGDSIAHPDAVPALRAALHDLLAVPGVFVFGSNDYYAPRFKSPTRYLHRHHRPVPSGPLLPFQDVRALFGAAGWVDLSNTTGRVAVDGRQVAFAGVDDPHIGRDDYAAVAGPIPADADLGIGVTHAPYRRVLDAMVADGYPLLLAGHTHGGQLCLPGYGALVTNCDIDRAQARGLSRYGPSWLHVSGGLGTSPYAPVRFACRPEASLLTLLPSDGVIRARRPAAFAAGRAAANGAARAPARTG